MIEVIFDEYMALDAVLIEIKFVLRAVYLEVCSITICSWKIKREKSLKFIHALQKNLGVFD